MKMSQEFKEGDVVVVNDPDFDPDQYPYDYSAWAHTRMTVTSVDGPGVTTQAIDERPDRAWILGNHRTGDPQGVHMYWPANLLKLAS
jgi:hypothetical protein